jgi:hypothetical protein
MKLVRAGQNGPEELYDLAKDKSETNNLAGERPRAMKRLRREYAKWNAPMAPPAWGPTRGNPGRVRKQS